MDSSTPTTPISHEAKPQAQLKSEDPTDPHIHSPPSSRKPPISIQSPNPVSLQDLLLLPPSPYKKPSRSQPRSIIVDECIDVASSVSMTPRRRGKSRAAGVSPRNARRARRRLEKESVREERELVVGFEEDVGRVKKKRQSSRSKVSSKGTLALVDSLPSPNSLQKDEGYRITDGLWELMVELVMWKNVAKSSLWFGLGTMFFMSSLLSKDVSFSMISAISHLGLLILGLAFFYDSVPQRQQLKPRGETFQLTEESILRVARLILPIANAVLVKSQKVFSGEPLMTLKVAPVLVFMARYGHLITPWRLFATGFFLSFTLPKLYSCYSDNIHKKVVEMRSYVWEAWKSCPRKKFVVATATTILWNLFSLKMRFFAAFISVVILRYHHQQCIGSASATSSEFGKREGEGAEIESREGFIESKEGEIAENGSREEEPEKAITLAE